MVRPGVDWKNEPRHIWDWFLVVVAVVLLSLYLYLWWTDGAPHYLAIGLVFVVWLGVYFTEYWQPILYLVVALAVALITGVVVVDGLWDQPLGQLAILLNIVVLLTSGYLFVYEER